MKGMKGWRTILFGVGVAAMPPALEYLTNVNWTEIGLSPTTGALIGAGIVGMRAVTNTSIFSK